MRRILRTYRRIAHIEHHCDKCQGPILPGDEYWADVVLADQHTGERKVIVFKEHIWPACDWPGPWDDDGSVEEDLDVDLKQAA
jgi:hypothetical protein